MVGGGGGGSNQQGRGTDRNSDFFFFQSQANVKGSQQPPSQSAITVQSELWYFFNHYLGLVHSILGKWVSDKRQK